MNHSKIDIQKVGTSALAGLAGGVAITAALASGTFALIIGGILGASATGYSEYQREKTQKNGHAKKQISKKEKIAVR